MTQSVSAMAIDVVIKFVNARAGETGDKSLTVADTYVVWSCKTLQNWKALVSTNSPDGKYYEVTYDGDEKRAYLDIYYKLLNVEVVDEKGDMLIPAGEG